MQLGAVELGAHDAREQHGDDGAVVALGDANGAHSSAHYVRVVLLPLRQEERDLHKVEKAKSVARG